MELDKNYKVRVTPEQSRQIQKLVFKLGGGWFGGHDGKHPIMLDADYLFLYSSMVLTYSYERGNCYFENKPNHTEIQADDLITLLTDLSKSDNEIDTSADSVDAPHVSEPRFKVGDRVYLLPNTRILYVNAIFGEMLTLEDDEGEIVCGVDMPNAVCQATPENHALLCKLYPHITFEQPPKQLIGSHLARLLCVRGKRRIYGYASNDKDMDLTGIEALCRGYNSDGFLLAGLPVPCKYFVPADIDTGEPLTEAVLNN